MQTTHLYITNKYPCFSETFIENEMLELVRKGDRVVVYSIHKPENLPPKVEYFAPQLGSLRALFFAPRSIVQTTKLYFSGLPFLKSHVLHILFAQIHANHCQRYLQKKTNHLNNLVIHAHFLGLTTDIAILINSNLPTKKIVTVHGGDSHRGSHKEVNRWRLYRMDLVIAASEFVSDNLNQICDSNMSVIIPCGIYFNKLPRSEMSKLGKELDFVTVARFIESKGYMDALSVICELSRNDYKVKWDIVGDGPLFGDFKKEINKLENQNLEIILHGSKPNSETLHLIAAADIFILMSKPVSLGTGDGDGIPVVLMEAMAMRKLVVTTSAAGIPELVKDGFSGLLVESDNSQKSFEKIVRVINDNIAYSTIVENAFQTVFNNYNLIHTVERLKSVLTSPEDLL